METAHRERVLVAPCRREWLATPGTGHQRGSAANDAHDDHVADSQRGLFPAEAQPGRDIQQSGDDRHEPQERDDERQPPASKRTPVGRVGGRRCRRRADRHAIGAGGQHGNSINVRIAGTCAWKIGRVRFDSGPVTSWQSPSPPVLGRASCPICLSKHCQRAEAPPGTATVCLCAGAAASREGTLCSRTHPSRGWRKPAGASRQA